MNTTVQKDAVLLKGSLFTLTVIQLLSHDVDDITNHLQYLAQQSPKFFQHTPVVIDLQHITDTQAIDFSALKQELRDLRMIPVGVRHVAAEYSERVIEAGLAILPVEAKNTTKKASEYEQPKPNAQQSGQNKHTPTKLITQPVRSGQQIYAQGADLLVLAPVSHGAELLADGHIHIYAPLRGRALAGINGNTDARIFCKQLDAELVSIAGYYRLKEDLPPCDQHGMVQICLEGERLLIHEV
jgi:septum site-determining protein MinC